MSKGAPQGNQFWKLRSKHGRDKIFTDPNKLLESCFEYFERTDARTDWDEPDWVGKDAREVVRHHRTPFTISGLCLFLDITSKTWENYRNEYSESTDEIGKDFFRIITHVEQIIETQQFEGATVGAYNANIIARKLGLADKKQHEVSEEVPVIPDFRKKK